MGLREQSTVGCFPELCFSQFYVAWVLVRLLSNLYIMYFFPLSPVLLVTIIIFIINTEKLIVAQVNKPSGRFSLLSAVWTLNFSLVMDSKC